MRTSTEAQGQGSPEAQVGGLVAQLRKHVLWDALLIFSPPLLVALYLALYLQSAAWIAPITWLLISGAVVGVGMLAVAIHVRPLIPSVRSVARLIDEKTKAKDRFLTLATIDVNLWPAAFVGRLRGEAAALLQRIDFRGEFPYRIKPSFYWSLLGSLIAAALFQFLLMGASVREVPAHQKLGELAEKMDQQPPLSALAHALRALATKLQQANASEEEKQTLIHQTLEAVEEQQKKKDQEQKNRDLLNAAVSTLQGLEQQSGRDQQKDSEAGDGNSRNSPSQGGQDGKQREENGNDGKGELNTQRSQGMQQRKGAPGDPKEQGQEKNQQNQGDGKSTQPDFSKADKDTGPETSGKTRGGGEKLGRSRSEEIPQGAPPAERFHKPGEQGKDGVKGARYVTVQLPEEMAADSKGEGTLSKQSKEANPYTKGPVSNIPLPAHVPDAPAEKQQLPLEYRGIIR